MSKRNTRIALTSRPFDALWPTDIVVTRTNDIRIVTPFCGHIAACAFADFIRRNYQRLDVRVVKADGWLPTIMSEDVKELAAPR